MGPERFELAVTPPLKDVSRPHSAFHTEGGGAEGESVYERLHPVHRSGPSFFLDFALGASIHAQTVRFERGTPFRFRSPEVNTARQT